MKFRFNHTSNFVKMLVIAQFILLSYLLYEVTYSIYKNYQIEELVGVFQAKIEDLEKENLKIAEDVEYVSSVAYIEKIKKQNDGLVMPGEEVIVLPKVSFENEDESFNLGRGARFSSEIPNYKIWWEFIFGGTDWN